MARGCFRMTCLLIVLAVQRGVQSAASTTQTDQSWNDSVLSKLSGIENALSKRQSSCGEGLDAGQMTKMQNQIDALRSLVSSLKIDLQSTKLKLQKTVRDMRLRKDQGSTFVRWGRKTCPDNTTLVYSGVAGGREWKEKGSGTNRLCLTRSPQFDNTPVPLYYGHLYGGEYQYLPGHHDHDVPCSVCRAPQSTTIMMAGTLTCSPGWTAQYTGHLTSSNWEGDFATEYVCLDGNPENDYSGGLKDENGLLFYYVITVCGSLPCPPYKNKKVVTCVVCSK